MKGNLDQEEAASDAWNINIIRKKQTNKQKPPTH